MIGRPNRSSMNKKAQSAKESKDTIKRLLTYMNDHYGKLAIIFTSVVMASLLGVAGPYFMGRAIDDYLTIKNLDGFVNMILLMFGVNVLGALFSWLMSYLTVQIAQDSVKRIRTDLFKRLQQLSLKFFDTNSDGDLTSRLTNDVDNISSTLNQSLTQLMSSVITIVAVVIMMFALSWQLSFVSFVMIPLIILLTKQIAKYTRKFFKDKMEALAL